MKKVLFIVVFLLVGFVGLANEVQLSNISFDPTGYQEINFFSDQFKIGFAFDSNISPMLSPMEELAETLNSSFSVLNNSFSIEFEKLLSRYKSNNQIAFGYFF